MRTSPVIQSILFAACYPTTAALLTSTMLGRFPWIASSVPNFLNKDVAALPQHSSRSLSFISRPTQRQDCLKMSYSDAIPDWDSLFKLLPMNQRRDRQVSPVFTFHRDSKGSCTECQRCVMFDCIPTHHVCSSPQWQRIQALVPARSLEYHLISSCS